MKRAGVLALAFIAWFVGSSVNATTINAVNKYAYGANIGWLDARGDGTNGAVIGQFYCSGTLWGANVGWISLGTGAPTNGWQYGNNAATDWGVNHDGAGKLRGHAYGANIGWIQFEDLGNPHVDLFTGNLSGYAYGANIGWISLANSEAFVQTDTLAPGPDTDSDGIPDAWELAKAGNLTTYGPAPDDDDDDGVPDIGEYHADTDPGDDTSYLHITDFAQTSSTGQVTWTVSPARLYRLEQSSSATNDAEWVDSGLGLVAPGPGPTLTRDVPVPGAPPALFFRAKAVVPLHP